MDLSDWNFPSDEEIADSRGGGKRDQSRIFITSLRSDTPQVYYFLTLPGEHSGDWVNFRELNTREGLRVGPDLPSELTYGVMVRDYRMVDNPITGKRVMEFDNNLDPLTAGTPGNQMWAQGARNVDKTGLIRVQTRCAVNVIDAITGYHKILKMSLTAKEDLVKYFKVKNEDGDFDVKGRPYEVLYTGEGFNWNLAIRPVRPGSTVIRDNKSIEIPRDIELPDEPVDVRQVLMEQREEMDAWLASLPTRSGKPIDTSLNDQIEDAPDFVKESLAEQNFEPSGMDAFAGGDFPTKDTNGKEKYLAMSPARLRAMHAKAGHDVKRGITKEELAASAATLGL